MADDIRDEQQEDPQEQKRALEKMGYTFDVDREETSHIDAEAERYHVVTISQDGRTLGTRTEITREQAMARAILFAQEHNRGEKPLGLGRLQLK